MAAKGAAGPAAAGASKHTKSKPSKRAKPAAAKQIDLDRQCGVELPNGSKCGRLLTCKTHSISAKRAVVGRSRPFDTLLVAYRQTRQVQQNAKSSQTAKSMQEDISDEAPLPPHEEIQQVLLGTLQSHATPLYRRVTYPVKSRDRYLRVREQLLGSLNRVPPLPSSSQSTGIAQLMSLTGAVLGRSVVYSPATGSQYIRQARIYRDPDMRSRLQSQQAPQSQAPPATRSSEMAPNRTG
ncbi:SAGA-associated factor 73 [Wickerhamiella sorbophila]|uniref:SAGA-associated factor 73 n=1 Tax=Wickerhamiella sorbophila TaxID=45607 RepID=A0A2T0FDY8_9ASCO|nr:SAGA-associated factor 73 [Wickerhamiella sorbophila]PRT53180.1 SAGA-associated factor 73 [Wickerhamiella sorbophila]